MRYKDATAFRAALSANLRNQYPGESINRLLKRAMMERFLARTTVALTDQAVLKGGLLARAAPKPGQGYSIPRFRRQRAT